MAASMVKNIASTSSVPPVVVVLGATGAGKSKLAIDLGKRFKGEVISADSMQVYKGLDIITNKVTIEEQDGVPHHFLDVIHPLSRFTIVDFRDRAVPVIDSLLNKGKMPIIVGGTNYYIEALLWRILIEQETQRLLSNEGLLLRDGDNADHIKLPKMCLKDMINQSEVCSHDEAQAGASEMNLKSVTDNETIQDKFAAESGNSGLIYSELSKTLSCIASSTERRKEERKSRIGKNSEMLKYDEKQLEDTLLRRTKEETETLLLVGDDSRSDKIFDGSCSRHSGDETLRQSLMGREGGKKDAEKSEHDKRCLQSGDGLGQSAVGKVPQNDSKFIACDAKNNLLDDKCDEKSAASVKGTADRPLDGAPCGISYVKEPTCEDGFVRIDVEGSSSQALHQILMQVDLEMALKLHPNDKRKIVRSLQVFQQHGRPHSEMLEAQRDQEGGGPLGGPLRYKNLCILWIQTEQEVLDNRLEERVETMMEAGLVEELSNFHNDYNLQRLHDGSKGELYVHGIFQSIGFKEFHPYLILSEEEKQTEHGKKLLLEGIERLKVVTKQYAKKQLRWIRKRFLKRPGDNVPYVYGVDSTCPEKWEDVVLKPAVDIVESILQGREPSQIPLKKEDPDFLPSEVTTHICDVCDGRKIVGPHQWHGHLTSRRHKKRAAQAKKRHLYQGWEQKMERKSKKIATDEAADLPQPGSQS